MKEVNFEDMFFNDLLDILFECRKPYIEGEYDEAWNASLQNVFYKVSAFFGHDIPEKYSIATISIQDENTFDKLIKAMLSIRIPNPTLYEHKAWNSALKVVLTKLYQFFNKGEMPQEICDLFIDSIAAPGSTQEIKPAVDNPINHPSYYCSGGIEVLDYILAKDMDFLLGQVCKYISRSGKKNPDKEIEDLEKAQFYLDKKIKLLKGQK